VAGVTLLNWHVIVCYWLHSSDCPGVVVEEGFHSHCYAQDWKKLEVTLNSQERSEEKLS